MASELDSTQVEETAPRDLPAPYVSPWSEFGRTFRALLADVQLRTQELLRRNLEGSLPVPGFWPQDLAPTFWPFVVVVGIGGISVLGWLGVQAFASPPAPKPFEQDQAVIASESLPPDQEPKVPVEMAPIEDSVIEFKFAEPMATPAPSELEMLSVVLPPAPDPLLLSLMDSRDPQSLLLAAEPVPADDLIQLRLAAESWLTLSSMERQRLADQWQDRLSDVGFDRLTLVDVDGHPLGRSALVGSGMILMNADFHPSQ